jgi:putative CocE/NonD family hydrolase
LGVRTEFPRRVRRIDHTWIPLADGTRLAARIWLPEDAEDDPVPAILEYLPYRKGDAMARRDSRHHPYFAGHGYAAVRVDIRGSGDSDGILTDEYTRQEQDDGLEVLAWLAAQPWCTGRVGLFGISWGGFNGLQIAARRPPELGAVISMCASDDRYADDVHYVGGCVLALDMLPWAATMLTLLAQPPDPATVGDGWRETWFARMERTPAFVEPWLRHQRRDDYWRQGSVDEDYARIDAPVYAIGGWPDGYTNAIPRLLAGLPGPRKGLIGPWSHAFPQDGDPGPAIGFLQECLRWWDHWLKDVDTGIMDEPVLRAWMQEPVAPAGWHAERPGRWVAEEQWPAPEIEIAEWVLAGDGLREPGAREPDDRERDDREPAASGARGAATTEQPLHHRSPQTTGQDAGAWCADGGAGDWPVDQRAEDGRSLTFTSPPLDAPLEVLGFPEVALALAADRPRALVAVRLCDVAPDGSSLLVTRGLLNLAHRDGHDRATPLEPGRRYDVTVRLDAIGQRIPAGHRLRVAISTAYWPWAWPSPEPATLTVFAGPESRLRLPVRPPRDSDAALAPFPEPEWSAPLEQDLLRSDPTSRTLRRDLATGAHEVAFRWDVGGHRRLADNGAELDDTNVTTYRIVDGDPLSASVRCRCASTLARGAWHTRVETDSRMTATATEFLVTHSLDAYEGDERVYARTWTLAFPRDGV